MSGEGQGRDTDNSVAVVIDLKIESELEGGQRKYGCGNTPLNKARCWSYTGAGCSNTNNAS